VKLEAWLGPAQNRSFCMPTAQQQAVVAARKIRRSASPTDHHSSSLLTHRNWLGLRVSIRPPLAGLVLTNLSLTAGEFVSQAYSRSTTPCAHG